MNQIEARRTRRIRLIFLIATLAAFSGMNSAGLFFAMSTTWA